MNTPDRLALADAHIEAALLALTRAVCLLGFSEGMQAVQIAHITATQARDAVRLMSATAPRMAEAA